MPIVVTGLSHHSSPVELRERFAFSDAQIADALGQLREQGIADESVILSTCNRVEIYAATRDDDPALGQALRRRWASDGRQAWPRPSWRRTTGIPPRWGWAALALAGLG